MKQKAALRPRLVSAKARAEVGAEVKVNDRVEAKEADVVVVEEDAAGTPAAVAAVAAVPNRRDGS